MHLDGILYLPLTKYILYTASPTTSDAFDDSDAPDGPPLPPMPLKFPRSIILQFRTACEVNIWVLDQAFSM